jgi:hypothetical protein
MNKRKILFLFLFLINSFLLFSQTFKGKILTENNKPLEDVYVHNITTNRHAHTNAKGIFILEGCSISNIVKVSLLGYRNIEITLKQQDLESDIIIVLQEENVLLDELVILKRINPLQEIVKIDLANDPVKSSQEILQKIPGLFIGQHAGGGKAEQIFLRGFDIDHGTDLALSFDGMPVNMVSHAHGQGYSDLHFIIPETIETIDFGKGPYYANYGDFNTAGYVTFNSKKSIDKNTFSVSLGQFNTFRKLGMFNIIDKPAESAYAAVEYIETDGFVESPQNFHRLNVFAKYHAFISEKTKLSLTTSHFTSKWDASGQIPQRAVDAGIITRFGAIDDTEGGQTSRTNLNLEMNSSIDETSQFKGNIFYSKYAFELFSNFTFFLDDPVNGDQIKQKENRDIFGVNSEFIKKYDLKNTELALKVGTGIRLDIIDDVALSKTLNRKTTLSYTKLGDVHQNNFYAYINPEFELDKFIISPAIRLDYFNFSYNDALLPIYKTQTNSDVVVNPKLNIIYNPNHKLQWFIKSGIGFHSNDARVSVLEEDNVIPRAYGVDFGNVWKPTPKLLINSALWYLFSEQEFVYVGDAGIVEPSGKSRRLGIDLGLRYQLSDWLYFNSDFTYTNARSIDEPDGSDHIPLAPKITATGGLFMNDFYNFSGGLQFKHIADRAANEDNSIIAEGYFIADFNLNYSFNNFTVGVAIDNVFDTEWIETQFATESRLQNELNPVEEIHFTPGTPFAAKFIIMYKF